MPDCRSARCLPAAFALAAIALASCQMPRTEPTTPQPALSRHVDRHAAALAHEGIVKIVAWSPQPGQPVQVTGRHGAIYFPWRAEAPFAAFAIDVGPDRAGVRADAYGSGDEARFAAALDFAVRESLRLARDQNALMDERERARP